MRRRGPVVLDVTFFVSLTVVVFLWRMDVLGAQEERRNAKLRRSGLNFDGCINPPLFVDESFQDFLAFRFRAARRFVVLIKRGELETRQ
jgi:hypothetical protein